jgi:hypothetical protein
LAGVLLRTNFYIDGFNLYYGAVKGTPYKWLDLEALCHRLCSTVLDRRAALNRVRYFTALVNGTHDPMAPFRQRVFLRALATRSNVTVHLGFFLSSVVKATVANPPPIHIMVRKTEEKGSDVNLATYLLPDGVRGEYDQAVVITNDSDLCEPIRAVRSEFQLSVGFINPSPTRRPSVELGRAATFTRRLRTNYLAGSQFPPTLNDAAGMLHKPPSW